MRANRRTKRGARALFRLCAVNGTFDGTRAREVSRMLAASQARGALALLSAFAHLVRLEMARRTAVVESATELPPRTRSDIESLITLAYRPSPLVTYAQNPALIGGVRLRVGSHVYDSSVRARLSALEADLVASAAR